MFLLDDLASKANIVIDPAEIQASSMDDLDEDEESGAAQVCVCSWLCTVFQVCLLIIMLGCLSIRRESVFMYDVLSVLNNIKLLCFVQTKALWCKSITYNFPRVSII